MLVLKSWSSYWGTECLVSIAEFSCCCLPAWKQQQVVGELLMAQGGRRWEGRGQSKTLLLSGKSKAETVS